MAQRELVPWRWGGTRRWEPEDRPLEAFHQEIDALHREMDRIFEGFWPGGEPRTLLPAVWGYEAVSPRIDETEDDKAFHVKVELPGMDQKDVEVTLSDGQLTIKGEKKREEEEKGKDFYRRERSFGGFRRTVPIPGEVDESKIEATFEKGVLSIELPKSEEALRNIKHIAVKAA